MASEMISKVQQAEKLADEAMEKALLQSQKIIDASKERIAGADATSRNQTDIKAKRIIDTAGGVARENAIKAEKAAFEKGQQLKTEAKAKQAAVNRAVLDEILA